MTPVQPDVAGKAIALADSTRDVATVLAEQASAEAARLAREGTEASIRLAEQRGVERAKLESRLDANDRRFDSNDTKFAALNGSIERTATSLREVTGAVGKLTVDFDTHMTLLADRANTHAAEMSKQVSTRTFILCGMGAMTGLLTLAIQFHPFG
jgi:hypothetical protein